MEDILLAIRQELEANVDEKAKQSGQRYFKEEVHLIGVKSAVVEKIGRDYFKLLTGKTKSQIFFLCEELLKSGFMEESFIACHWSYYVRKEYQPGDLAVFENWIDRYVSNWVTCDTLCNHTVGHFIEQYPEYISELKGWANPKTGGKNGLRPFR